MILFLADVGVKVNRKILLCKRSGDGENHGSEDPPLKKGEQRPRQSRGRRGRRGKRRRQGHRPPRFFTSEGMYLEAEVEAVPKKPGQFANLFVLVGQDAIETVAMR